MKKYGEVLLSAYKTLCLLVVSGVGFLLFFLWFPDFVSWLSVKLAVITEGTIAYAVLSLLPLAFMIGGIFFLAVLAMFSIRNYWGTTEEITTA